MTCYTEMDELQEALKKVKINEEVMPIYKGHVITENEDTYCKIQKLLNCNEMEDAHYWLYDLDYDNLENDEIDKVNKLFDLGVKKGYIDNSFNDEFAAEQAAEQTATTPVVEPAPVKNTMKVRIPCWTVLYSATDKFGNMKCGECYSNSLNVQSAKADALAKLSRFGYENVSILAIEAGDPDMAGCDDICCEDEETEDPKLKTGSSPENDKPCDLCGNNPCTCEMKEAEEDNSVGAMVHQGKSLNDWFKEFKGEFSVQQLMRMARSGTDLQRLLLTINGHSTLDDSEKTELKEAIDSNDAIPEEVFFNTNATTNEITDVPEISEADFFEPVFEKEEKEIKEAKSWKVAWFDNEENGVAEFETKEDADKWISNKEVQERYNPTGWYCDDPVNEAETEINESGNPYVADMKVITDTNGNSTTTKPKRSKSKTSSEKIDEKDDDKKDDSKKTSKTKKPKDDDKSDDAEDDNTEEVNDDSASDEESSEDTTASDDSSDESNKDTTSDETSNDEESSDNEEEESSDEEVENDVQADEEKKDSDSDAEEDEEAEKSSDEETENTTADEESSEESSNEETNEKSSEEENTSDEDNSESSDEETENATADEESSEESSDEEKKALSDDEKSDLKDNYKQVFKSTMTKCKFTDKSFSQLSIEQKVKFFEALNKAWQKDYEPTEFMTDKEIDQLEATVVKK